MCYKWQYDRQRNVTHHVRKAKSTIHYCHSGRSSWSEGHGGVTKAFVAGWEMEGKDTRAVAYQWRQFLCAASFQSRLTVQETILVCSSCGEQEWFSPLRFLVEQIDRVWRVVEYTWPSILLIHTVLYRCTVHSPGENTNQHIKHGVEAVSKFPCWCK